MNVGPNISQVAAIIADPSRGKMLASLMNLDGLPASELAAIAGITPQTTSFHLRKMIDAGLVKVSSSGRHKYFSISSEEIANLLERLSVLAQPKKLKSTKELLEHNSLKTARTCYGHLAGRLGVAVFAALSGNKMIATIGEEVVVTHAGHIFFAQLDILVPMLQQKRRELACTCLDWTERKYHLAGSLGVAMADLMLERKWLKRIPDSRALLVTKTGAHELKSNFQVDVGTLGVLGSRVSAELRAVHPQRSAPYL